MSDIILNCKDNIMRYVKRDNFKIKYDRYQQYKPQLRKLFDYSCCYCTIYEGENKIGFFHVEHFKPKSKFPKLECEYENLLYACHKCNVYKKDYWIKNDLGCIKDCDNCKDNICRQKDIYRFIDPSYEDPKEYIEESDLLLIEKNNSKIGLYTIEMLRLNRKQLVKLRYARRTLFMWLEEEEARKAKSYYRLNKSKKQLERLNRILDSNEMSENEKLALKALQYALDKSIATYELEIINAKKHIMRISEIIYDARKRVDN
jgi:uncharacterized protein (TIGR02646 family)